MAETAVAEPLKNKIGKTVLLSFAFPLAFMFANYLVNFVGQFTGRKLSSPTPGACANDLQNLPDDWMKNIVWRAGFFTYFFCL
jgi:hypothetical protein